jgi:carbonic anhydrase
MEHLKRLLDNDRRWVAAMTETDPQFFAKRADKQEPHFLFIGCSDSRVPAETLTGVLPGEMFVHRNIANQVVPADLNVLSVLQFAIEALHIEHVIACGHYECGGVKAAMGTEPLGLVDNWLGNVRHVMRLHHASLDAIDDSGLRFRRLVDLNVIEQVYNLSRTPVVLRAWERAARPILHGLVYNPHDGLLHSLAVGIDGSEKADALPSD